MRFALAIGVFGLDLFALLSHWSRPAPRRHRIAWTAAIVFLPVVGAVAWLRAARARYRQDGAAKLEGGLLNEER